METRIGREKLETGNRVAVWWWNLFSEAEILYKFGKFWPSSCGIMSSDSLLEFWHLTFISGICLIDWCHQNNIRPLLATRCLSICWISQMYLSSRQRENPPVNIILCSPSYHCHGHYNQIFWNTPITPTSLMILSHLDHTIMLLLIYTYHHTR